MPKRTWTIEDRDHDLYVDQLVLRPGNVGGAAVGYSVVKRTLQAGPSKGVDIIEVNNGRFQFTIVPTRGMGIWKATMGDLQLGWQSPAKGLVHPSLVCLAEPDGLGWLGGFSEMLCRCGLESNGAPEFHPNGALRYGLHGRIANTPAHTVEISIDGDSGEIAVTGTVDEARMFGNKLRLTSTVTTRAGQPGMTITDTVASLSAESSEMELLYHVNFGSPFLKPGAKIVLPVKKLAPRDAVAKADIPTWDTYGPETPGLPEAVHFFELAAGSRGQTQALLCNAAGDRGVSMKFNKNQFPCFSLWKNRLAQCDGYVTGLEPATNFPNVKSFEKRMGRVVVLSPGESRTFEMTIEAHADAASVNAAAAAVKDLQATVKPEIHTDPDPAWSGN